MLLTNHITWSHVSSNSSASADQDATTQPPEIDYDDIMIRAVGGIKKGRISGLGSAAQPILNMRTRGTATSAYQNYGHQIQQLHQDYGRQIQEMQEKHDQMQQCYDQMQ